MDRLKLLFTLSAKVLSANTLEQQPLALNFLRKLIHTPQETDAKTFHHAPAASIFTTTMLFLNMLVAIDLFQLFPNLSGSEYLPTFSYILLSSSILAIGSGLVVKSISLLLQFINRYVKYPRVVGSFVAVFIAYYPAATLANILTEGKILAVSPWRQPLNYLVFQVLIGASVLVFLIGLTPKYGVWSSTKRWVWGLLLIGTGIAAVGGTTLQPTNYIRLHRGILVLAALLLQIGLSLLPIFRSTGNSRKFVNAHKIIILTVILVGAYGLTQIGKYRQPQIGLHLFSHSFFAQKMMPMLFAISPISAASQEISFRGTRLEQFNSPPMPPLLAGKYNGYNVVLVTADAFRADVVGLKKYGVSLTPHLNQLSQRALIFNQAIADYSHTSRSILSFLSGRWNVNFPSEQEVSSVAEDIADRNRLPRLLRQAGYFSAAIMMGGRWMDAFFTEKYITNFDLHAQPGSNCKEQVLYFSNFLKQHSEKKPFFTWMHIVDTHHPVQYVSANKPLNDSPLGQYYTAARDVDNCVGEIITALKKTQKWEKTIFIFSADHGEAFDEHMRTSMHSTCYYHDLHIPLIFRTPDLVKTQHINYRFQLSDLLPTLATLLGINTRGETLEGDDLSGFFNYEMKTEKRGVTFSKGHPEQYPCASVMADQWHLIYTLRGEFYELYNVDQDPAETLNLIKERPEVVNALRPWLDKYWSIYKIRHHSPAFRAP